MTISSDASLPGAEPEAAVVASCWWDHPELTADERAGLDAAFERVPEARVPEAGGALELRMDALGCRAVETGARDDIGSAWRGSQGRREGR